MRAAILLALLTPLAVLAEDADVLSRRGGEQYKLGKLAEALAAFDRQLELRPADRASHWRRGIVLYDLGRYADGAEQFAAGKVVYGNDVENAFWHYLCNARRHGVEKARTELLAVGTDRRVPLMRVYDLIRGTATPDDVFAAVAAAKLDGDDLRDARFYAHLYVGLEYEARGEPAKAREHLTAAVEKYAVPHYMADVARVRLKSLGAK